MGDWFGWIGNACLLFGSWNLAHKHRWAFIFTVIGGCCWLHEAITIQRADWIFIEAAAIAIALRNYWKWGGNG